MERKRKLFYAQSLGEYTVMLSLAVLAIMAMTYFIQRAFQARVSDGRLYMLTTLDADMKDVHLKRGGTPYEGLRVAYEPYYVDKVSTTSSDVSSNVLLKDAVYQVISGSTIAVNSVSHELAPKDE